MLERNENKAWVAGVCAGLAEQYMAPISFIRLMFVVTFLMFGLGLALYAYYWAIMPGGNNQLRMDFT
jgi:phage shock protein PspC (stress-responsive transcriptional regulator)